MATSVPGQDVRFFASPKQGEAIIESHEDRSKLQYYALDLGENSFRKLGDVKADGNYLMGFVHGSEGYQAQFCDVYPDRPLVVVDFQLGTQEKKPSCIGKESEDLIQLANNDFLATRLVESNGHYTEQVARYTKAPIVGDETVILADSIGSFTMSSNNRYVGAARDGFGHGAIVYDTVTGLESEFPGAVPVSYGSQNRVFPSSDGQTIVSDGFDSKAITHILELRKAGEFSPILEFKIDPTVDPDRERALVSYRTASISEDGRIVVGERKLFGSSDPDYGASKSVVDVFDGKTGRHLESIQHFVIEQQIAPNLILISSVPDKREMRLLDISQGRVTNVAAFHLAGSDSHLLFRGFFERTLILSDAEGNVFRSFRRP
jgi:hypothetical protein